MSLPRIIASAAYALIGIVLGVRGSMVLNAMLTEVNRQLPKEQRFGLVGWHFLKSQRLFSEYRRLYPDGPRIRQVRTIEIIMFASLAICGLVFFLSQP